MKYAIIVKPGKSEEKIIASGDHELTIYLRAKAHDGEANEALITTLAKYFDIPKTSIHIVRGHKSRLKLIEF